MVGGIGRLSYRRLCVLVLAAAGILLAGLGAGCGDGAPAATVAPRATAVLAKVTVTAAPSGSAFPGGTALLPTPRAGNSVWARERVDAVVALYRPTAAGAALLRSLDFRQMRGEPGFFGSYGFGSWAGAGEAKPIGVMHELMHSYWGGFPVMGRPELDWVRGDGGEVAPALAAYHRDVLAFMAQPPDDYELLRQRLRNLPEVSAENPYPLFHSLEADLPYSTGGDLDLVPPILRKYWGLFLAPGPFHNWERAAGWYQSLSGEDRAVAGGYLGFEHLDLRGCGGLGEWGVSSFDKLRMRDGGIRDEDGGLADADGGLADADGGLADADGGLAAEMLADASMILAGEERQRLTDFAAQFDLLVGDARLEENFQFWRGYLRDKVWLYGRHPGHLGSAGLGRAGELAEALAFMSGLEGDASGRAERLARGIAGMPLLVNFLPAADNGTLLELFGGDPELPDAPTLRATASFVERLQIFAGVVDRVLAEGRESPERGARALEGFVADRGLDAEQDLRLFFDLFRDAGGDGTARRIAAAMDQGVVRGLMAAVPVQLRGILGPGELLELLDVTAGAADGDLRRGIGLLVGEPSGNYRIDEPFLEGLYAVMTERARGAPLAAARVMGEPGFPLEGMILHQPGAAALALGSDLELAADLVAGGDAVTSPPARIVWRLIGADPGLAAGVVRVWAERGEDGLVTESLAYLAYDKVRGEKFPGLGISISGDGAFLGALLEGQGAEWLEARLAGAVSLYRGRAAAGEAPADFLERWRDTLAAAADALGQGQGDRQGRGDLDGQGGVGGQGDLGGRLGAVIRGAFDSGLGTPPP